MYICVIHNKNTMDINERIGLVEQVGEEILTRDELKILFETKQSPVAYDGFEPSGRIHIAQGIMRSINVNKMIKAGCKFIMLVADWHALANNKLSGDIEKIKTTGEYFVEVWKACGMDVDKVKFVYGSDVVKDNSYWMKVLNIARSSTIQRLIRCSQIMGRQESDQLSGAQLMYPCMQAADIFQLGIDIAQLGMDQRKVNILAREIGPKIGFGKPIAVHHHMLMGLLQPSSEQKESIEKSIEIKMSKSNPDSAIFMDDSEHDIVRKINKAYCPPNSVHENPIMEYCKYIIFEKEKEFNIERPKKFGGNLKFFNYNDLQSTYEKGEIHPMDVKSAVAKQINLFIEPVRKHFEKGKPKKLLEQVYSFQVTR